MNETVVMSSRASAETLTLSGAAPGGTDVDLRIQVDSEGEIAAAFR